MNKQTAKIRTIDSDLVVSFLLNLDSKIIVIWIIINISIPVFTIFYYFWQFEFYHPIFWIFIPDSYIYAILFGIFLIVTFIWKKNVQILNIVTFIGLIKVFFAYLTLLIVIPSFFSVVSLVAHIIEFIQGMITLLFIRANNRDFSVASFIVVLDWFFDFFNPFGLPTLFLYPYHPDYNANPVSPFILPMFIVFSVLIFLLLIVIRLNYWTIENKMNPSQTTDAESLS